MYPLFTSAQTARLDAALIAAMPGEDFGYELMRRAAQSCYDEIMRRWPTVKSVTIFTGAGNNGGDGYEIGSLLCRSGCEVSVVEVMGAPAKQPAARARETCLAHGAVILDSAPLLRAPSKLATELVIDAMLGGGLNRPLTGNAVKAVECINKISAPVLAVDIPSGLSADTGCALPHAVHADLTVTFIARKQGLYTGDAKDCCGRIVYADLQADRAVFDQVEPAAWLLGEHSFKPIMPRRQNSHKGDYGHVLVVGGDFGTAGAVRLAAEAAMRCGAALVSIATRAEHAAEIVAGCPVLMVHGITLHGTVLRPDIDPLLEKADVLVVGPGLGRNDWSRALFSKIIEADRPKVVDADALNLLAEEHHRADNWILTPHPGEAGRLLGVAGSEVQTDRFSAGRRIASRFGGVCVLKGAGTVVCSEARTAVCPVAIPALATAGTGDVLSGVVAALIAQGDSLQTAAERGVYLHACAGIQAAGGNQRGMLATDLMRHLQMQVNA